MLLYGIITYGLILAAQSDAHPGCGRRRPIRHRDLDDGGRNRRGPGRTDVGWMDKTCAAPAAYNTTTCTFSPNPADAITAFACQMACPSNANAHASWSTVAYNYSSTPLFPEMPGLGVITPSTLSSTNVLQISTPSS